MKTFAASLLLCLQCGVAVAQQGWSLRGDWQQASVLVGKAEPGTQVWFNGRKLAVSAQGDFIFALDRDEKSEAELNVQLPGSPLPETYRYPVMPRSWSVQRVDGLPDDKVTPPASEIPRIQREAWLIKSARLRELPNTDFTGAMQWPVLGRISGVFGNQRILNGVPKQPHYGVDVAVPTGTPLAAPLGGVVTLARPDFYYTGGTVIIDHGHGLSSIMVHLSKLLVKKDQVVRQGEIVAEAGMTGRATGPHLHWGVYWFGARVDAQRLVPPMPELPARKAP